MALDVDGTLYDGTLGFSLLHELESRGYVKASLIRAIHEFVEEYRMQGVGCREDLLSICEMCAFAIKGVPCDVVIEASESAWKKVRQRLMGEARKLLYGVRAEGCVPVLLSGSPQVMIDRIADELGVKYRYGIVSSVEGDHYTDHLISVPAVPDVKVDLVRNLASRLGIPTERSLAIGNSTSDHELLKVVGYPIAFEPDGSLLSMAREFGWRIADRDTAVDIVCAAIKLSHAVPNRGSIGSGHHEEE
ncbi:HAD family hydrolase [Streptomyces sp. NPDC127068]|uniref:HAD family hydrolase n=1 Tax=Streptomyces sp. NPDC127068 TaxID=3347127 RepID=UPI0036625A48